LYLFDATVGVNKTYGGSHTVPPNQHFFVGGPESVRGFKSGYIGPLDSNGYPGGGNFEIYAQNEIVIPSIAGVGGAASASARFSFFMDFGSAFTDPGDFDVHDLYRSVGLAGQFVTPMGVMRVSLGWPLGHVSSYRKETFQFTVGRRF
jgi:outer membrane protein insertion porin family